MGEKHSQSFYRAIGVHDARWVNSAYSNDSTATQDGAEPDQPVPTSGQESWAQLESYGTAPAGTTYTVQAVKEGAPTGDRSGGRFAWRSDADVDNNLGWLGLNKVTGYTPLKVHEGISAGSPAVYPARQGYQCPHAIRTPEHHVIMVYNDFLAGAVACGFKNANNDAWTYSTVYTRPAASSSAWVTPTVVRLPSGRVICFYQMEEITLSTGTQRSVGMSYSDDNGSTWTEGARHIYPFTGEVGNMIRAVYHAGYITLLDDDGHYVSADLGVSFTKITDAHDSNFDVGLENNGSVATWTHALFGDLVALPDGGVLLVKPYLDGAPIGYVKWWKKYSPYGTFNTDANAGTFAPFCDANDYSNSATATYLQQVVCACLGDDGYVYAYWRGDDGGSDTRSSLKVGKWDPVSLSDVTSEDDDLYSSLTATYNAAADVGADDNAYLAWFSVVPCKGSHLVLTNQRSSNSTQWFSIAELRVGGYSSFDWADQHFGSASIPATGTYSQPGVLYVPHESPSGLAAWTATGAGAVSINADGELEYANGGTTAVYWEAAGGSATEPMVAWVRVKTDSVGASNSLSAHVRLTQGDGSDGYRVTLYILSQQIRIDDVFGSTTLATVSGLASGTFRDYLIVLEAGKVNVLYRGVNSTRWTSAASGTLTSNAGAYTNEIRWGDNETTTQAGSTYWRMVGFCGGVHEVPSGVGDAASYTNPTDLRGRPFSLRPLYIENDTRLSALGSSAYRGDKWTVPTRYEYGVQNLDPTICGSPSVPWRAINDSAEQTLIWELDGSATTAMLLSSSVYVYIGRPNFPTAYFEGYDVTGAVWTNLLTIDAVALGGLSYTRNGSHVTVDTTASKTADRYIQMDELVNGYFVFDADGSAGGPFVRKIEANSEGLWTDAATRRLEIQVKNSDLAGIPATGDAKIIAPQVVAVRHKLSGEYQKFRIRIPAATTAEGKLSAGVISAGPLVIIGRDYDYPWTWATEPNTEVTEGADGQRRVQKLGPARRSVELSWPEGWDQTKIQGDSPDPDYIVARDAVGYEGIGVRDDATILEGLVHRTQGGRYPVVLIPKLDPATGSSDQFSYTGVSQMLYGRTLGGVTRQVINGDDWTDEVAVVNAVTIEEEV
jgi:hypothetical protein